MFIKGGWTPKSNEVKYKIPIDLNGSQDSMSCSYEKYVGFSASFYSHMNAGPSEESLQMLCRERQP